jgi:hypothetical protein
MEHFEGQRPSPTIPKSISACSEDHPPSIQCVNLGFGVVGECLWPSKHSNVMAMHHHHNKGVFWGPYTLSSPPKDISAYPGDHPPSIQHVRAVLIAFCGVLWGCFCLQGPWWCWVAVVSCWPLITRSLRQHKPTVEIVQIYLNVAHCLGLNIFLQSKF